MNRILVRTAGTLAVLAAVLLLGAKCSLFNKAPAVPALTGPGQGVAGVPVTFKATATDPDGDSIAFQFDWGDTTAPAWSAFLASGETLSAAHTYADSGNYTVRARAKDRGGKESGWSVEQALELIGAGPGYLDSVLGSIALPWSALAACMSQDGALLGIGGVSGRDSIVVIRTSDRSSLMRIGIGQWPGSLAFSTDNRFLFASSMAGDTPVVCKIDIAQAAIVATAPTAELSYEIAVTPDGSSVLLGSGSAVVVLRADNLAASDSVQLPYPVSYLTSNASGSVLYVSTYGGIGMVDLPNCSLMAFTTAVNPARVQVLSPDGRLLYASSHSDSGLAVLQANDLMVVDRINIHRDGVGAMQPSADGHSLYISWGGILIMDLRTSTVLDSVDLPSRGLPFMHPNGDSLYYVGGSAVYVVGRR